MPNHTVGADMGEGYGIWKLGDEEGLMGQIHIAHIACGFHASDFMIMDTVTKMAKEKGIRVGAHPSLPDRQGFGRREMKMDPDEFHNCLLYQVGAVSAFMKRHGVEMNHIKPHGSAYGMCARDPELAKAAIDVAKLFGVAFCGLAGTEHQKAAEAAGVPFIAEWFVDLDYTPEGKLIISRVHPEQTIEGVKRKTIKVLTEGKVTTLTGEAPLGAVEEVSCCLHSDTPGVVELARAVREVVEHINKTGQAPVI